MTPAKYAKLFIKFEKAEADLMRAARKWDKLRAQVRRAGKTLDKEFVKRATDIGGECDIRELAELSQADREYFEANPE